MVPFRKQILPPNAIMKTSNSISSTVSKENHEVSTSASIEVTRLPNNNVVPSLPSNQNIDKNHHHHSSFQVRTF